MKTPEPDGGNPPVPLFHQIWNGHLDQPAGYDLTPLIEA